MLLDNAGQQCVRCSGVGDGAVALAVNAHHLVGIALVRPAQQPFLDGGAAIGQR